MYMYMYIYIYIYKYIFLYYNFARINPKMSLWPDIVVSSITEVHWPSQTVYDLSFDSKLPKF